jgi:transposase
MLSLPPSVRIFVCLEPTDMRRSFDGLAHLAQAICRGDPFSGHYFVFGNRRHDRVKILFWDNDGFVVYAKRLEEGTFRFPSGNAGSFEMNSEELWALMSGIDLASARRKKRYRRPI